MGKRKCSVDGCKSESHLPEHIGVTFHKVPPNPEIRPKWLKECHISEDRKLLYVCSRHFLRADFRSFNGSKYMLRQGILPSIFPWNKHLKKSEKTKAKTTDLLGKRIRKQKLNPDYVTGESRKKKSEPKASEKVPDVSDGKKTQESEESTSEESMPPVLEPENFGLPKVDNDNIPKLELSTKSDGNLGPFKKRKTEPATPTTSIIKSKIIVEDKCSPLEIKTHEIMERSKLKEKQIDENQQSPTTPVKSLKTSEKAVMDSPKTPSTHSKLFEPQTRIEALDFNQSWRPAIILEVDYEENEVLVHFDSYSNKYDEWIAINSSSIRFPKKETADGEKPINDPPKEPEILKFEQGDRCNAYWTEHKKFPGFIKEVIDHETYVVEFDDGYLKTLNVSKIMKGTAYKRSKKTKQHRRIESRRLNVQGLFKKRVKSNKSTSSSLDKTTSSESLTSQESGYIWNDNLWYPTFVGGTPVGVPSHIKTKKGNKSTIIVSDPNLPEGWEKHAMKREAGKWNCIIVTPDGRKLRCRSDIQRYAAENPDFKIDDYSINSFLIPRRIKQQPQVASTSASQEKSEPDVETTPPCAATPSRIEPQLKILQVDGGFQCPIEGCGKNFRRENLVQMHVKHYHPEFKKYLESTPNVLDLVYQRLHGDDFELSPSRSSGEYSKKTSAPIDEITNTNANDALIFEQKNSEIKKLLTSPLDCSEGGSQSSTASTSLPERKLKELSTDSPTDRGPDLKALAVTTKSGLKTIPPLKKVVDDSDKKDLPRKRKIEELGADFEGQSSDSGLLGENEFVMQQPQPTLDHIIGEDGKVIKIEHMRKEEIINCTCGITEEDGLMIQCEICMCWQHAHCNNIYREVEVPEKYVCYICQHPYGQRTSLKYFHDQDWLKHGVLPTGSYHYKDEEVYQKRFENLRVSHDLTGGLIELKDYLHSLKYKAKIGEMKNHPKLYLWSKPWEKYDLPEERNKTTVKKEPEEPKENTEEIKVENDVNEFSNIPQPEAAIETADCRLNLLDHISHCQTLIESRLDYFESKINELVPNPLTTKDENDFLLSTSMLVKDLGTMREFSQFNTF